MQLAIDVSIIQVVCKKRFTSYSIHNANFFPILIVEKRKKEDKKKKEVRRKEKNKRERNWERKGKNLPILN